MARLERRSFTRWENGVAKTYYKGDDVPDLKPGGDPEKPNVFLTLEEGAKMPARQKTAAAKVAAPAPSETGEDNGAGLDIIELLEGNVPSVVSHIASENRIGVLEDILVAEGEGKNRSTVTSAINDRIKVLEQEEG